MSASIVDVTVSLALPHFYNVFPHTSLRVSDLSEYFLLKIIIITLPSKLIFIYRDIDDFFVHSGISIYSELGFICALIAVVS